MTRTAKYVRIETVNGQPARVADGTGRGVEIAGLHWQRSTAKGVKPERGIYYTLVHGKRKPLGSSLPKALRAVGAAKWLSRQAVIEEAWDESGAPVDVEHTYTTVSPDFPNLSPEEKDKALSALMRRTISVHSKPLSDAKVRSDLFQSK